MQSLSHLSRPVPLWLLLLPLAIGLIAMLPADLGDLFRAAAPAGVDGTAAGGGKLQLAIPVMTVALVVALMIVLGVAAFVVYRYAGSMDLPAIAKPPTQADVARSGTLLDLEAARVVGLVATSIGHHVSFAQALGTAQDRIATIETPDQLRDVAAGLVADNQRMHHDTERMAAELVRSRAQIEELRNSLRSAQQEGLRDALTAIGNRRAFEMALKQAMAAAAKGGTPLSIIMADIDLFKKINDGHGHQVGDEVLKIVARLLSGTARSLDTVTRYGGEEFAIIMPTTVSMGASIVAERMRSRIESERLKLRSGEMINVTASFGVAQLRFGETAETLIGRADARLYKAKSQGRNLVITT